MWNDYRLVYLDWLYAFKVSFVLSGQPEVSGWLFLKASLCLEIPSLKKAGPNFLVG